MTTHPHTSGRRGAKADPRPLVLIFVRAENDLDHIAPVMDALLARDEVDLRAIIYDPLKTFDDDPRIEHLRARYGLDCRHAFNTPGAGPVDRYLSPRLQRLLWWTLSALRRDVGGRKKKLLMRFSRALRGHLELRLSKLAGERFLDPLFGDRTRGAVVFDHTMNLFAVSNVRSAQARGLQALALPHAVVHRMDAPDNPGDEDAPVVEGKPLRRPPGSHGYNLYDAVIAPNHSVSARMIKRGVLEDKITVLGSARFSKEWVDRLRTILPSFKTGSGGKAVLVILSKQTPLVDWPAVEKTIAHLAATAGLDVVIKIHPRSEMSGLSAKAPGSSLSLAPPNWNTASLIDWSDLVIFWGSSAIYDALRIGKPIIQLGYATSSHFDFEELIPSWQAATFEAFQKLLATCLETGEVNYRVEEAEVTISNLLDAGQTNIPEAYARFIECRAAAGRADSGVTQPDTVHAPAPRAAENL